MKFIIYLAVLHNKPLFEALPDDGTSKIWVRVK